MRHRAVAASGQKHRAAGDGEAEGFVRFLFEWNLKGNHTSTSSKISEGGARTIYSETSSLLGTFFVFCFFHIDVLPKPTLPKSQDKYVDFSITKKV